MARNLTTQCCQILKPFSGTRINEKVLLSFYEHEIEDAITPRRLRPFFIVDINAKVGHII